MMSKGTHVNRYILINKKCVKTHTNYFKLKNHFIATPVP